MPKVQLDRKSSIQFIQCSAQLWVGSKIKFDLEGDSYKFKLCSRPEFLSYPWFLLLLPSKEEFAEMQWYLDEYKISDFMLNL